MFDVFFCTFTEEKMYVAQKNISFKIKDVKTLFIRATDHITRTSWQNAERHVIEKVENRFWELDGVREEEVAPVIIDLGADSDDDDDEIDVVEVGPGGDAGPADAPAADVDYNDGDNDDDYIEEDDEE